MRITIVSWGTYGDVLSYIALAVESLATAIQGAINDQDMHTRLAEMSKKIQVEDGVMRAVEAFHQHLPVSKKSKLSTF